MLGLQLSPLRLECRVTLVNMSDFAPVTVAGKHLDAVLENNPECVLLALDFDGVLSDSSSGLADPVPHAAALAAVRRLSKLLGHVAVITAREAADCVRLAGFDPDPDLRLSVVGQHGVDRWDAATGRLTTAVPPRSLSVIERELPWILSDHQANGASVEDRGSTIAVHLAATDTEVTDGLEADLTGLAHRFGLDACATPTGWEIRPASADKGRTLRALAEETKARIVVYVGDNMVDLPAFEAVAELRREGVAATALYAGSTDRTLRGLADLDGADVEGVAVWLTRLADRLEVWRPLGAA